MKLPAPTAAQVRVLEMLDILTDNWGTPPSLREVAGELEVEPSTVMRHLRALHASGWVIRTEHHSRHYRLSEEANLKSLLRRSSK